MPLAIYNSRTRRKEPFTPGKPGEVGMYVCGVTVYDDAHIGHARCYVAFDAIHRHLLARGYRVTYVRNFTDIDDKIIRRAGELGLAWDELAARYMDSFGADMASLSVLPPTIEPRATAHMPEIIAQVQELIKAGHAYALDNGDVYFAVRSFPAYGGLSGRDLEDMMAGARVEVDERKQSPMDFALWKSSKPGEPAWESPWGPGRPGWHIECSAMSQKYLGATFDIHGGGKDLLFPHHENEMAQAEAATGEPFVRYWVHNGFVQINSEKMSKSLGNFFTIKDILKTTRPESMRLFLLSKHYRSPLDFSDQAIKDAAAGLERLYTALLTASQAAPAPAGVAPEASWDQEIAKAVEGFERGMDDDFNTAAAMGSLFGLARVTNRLAKQPAGPARDAGLNLCAARLKELGGRLGILAQDPQEFLQGQAGQAGQAGQTAPAGGDAGAGQSVAGGPDPAWIEERIAARQAARKAKDFAESDRIRDELTGLGVLLEDGPQGTRWRMKG
jgi:cysteinyl-tRNA synthetase